MVIWASLIRVRVRVIGFKSKLDHNECAKVIYLFRKVSVYNVFVLATDVDATFSLEDNVALIRIIRVVVEVKTSLISCRED
jgi:hypothetical protein